jgi:hypothetical protein
MVKRAEDSMHYIREKHRKEEYWFDEECMKRGK